ncbi:hypothetical protein ES705_48386 [subsurface metagenome]
MNELKPYDRNQIDFKKYMIGQVANAAIISSTVISSSNRLSKEMSSNTAVLGSNLQSLGISIGELASRLSGGIERLNAVFNYGFGQIISHLEIQSKMHENVLSKLDDIHKTLESPTMTEAREWFGKGLHLLSRKLLDKALEAFLNSIEPTHKLKFL